MKSTQVQLSKELLQSKQSRGSFYSPEHLGGIMSIDLATEIEIKEQIKETVKEPGKYKVIMLNDDATPMDFVVEILVLIFRHSEETARDLTMKIHDNGSAVVGIYTYEVAEQKSIEATKVSRENGFPLQVSIEKE